MFIKEKSSGKNLSHGYLREKLLREIKKELPLDREISREEKLRREMLKKIKEGELGKEISLQTIPFQ